MKTAQQNSILNDQTLQASLEILRSRSSRYAWYGTFIASCAVVLACLLVAQHFYSGISYENVLLAQRNNVAMWVLDAMPFVFAIWGQVVSRQTTEDAGSAIRLRTQSLRHDLRRERFNARMRTDYFARLSHEFRTPLNSILGLTETALLAKDGGMARADVEVVQGAAENLLALINDVLDFSAIETGRVELDRVEFDLRECVQNVCLMLRPQAKRKGLELILDVDTAVPGLVVGDPGRLRQILVNILGNAVKFTTQGAIRCELHSGGSRSAMAHRVEIAVRDTGPGMDERTLKHLFQPYRRANGHAARTEGTGLGLAITRELVDAMGGAITVSSTPGQGSVFAVEMPFEQQQGVNLATLARNIELRGVRLLLADAPGEERTRFETQLRTLGLDVTTVDDGVEAFKEALRSYAQGRSYELLVADLFVEHLVAEDLARELKQRPETADICLVSTTPTGARGDARRVKAAGFSGYFTKPIPPEHLAELLQATLATQALPIEQRESRGLITRHYIREYAARELSVLLVEDDKVNLAVTRDRLADLGCNVTTAATAAEALVRAGESEFHLVLLDYNLPDMRGDQVAEKLLAAIPQQSAPPIVMFSAGLTQAEKQRSRKSGAAGFLEKPASRDGLLAILQRHCALPSMAPERESPQPATVTPALRRVFNRESLVRIAAMEKAVGRHLDKESLYRIAHTMRSSARHVGATELAEAFDDLESRIRTGGDKSIRFMVAELLILWRNILTDLENEDSDRTVSLFANRE